MRERQTDGVEDAFPETVTLDGADPPNRIDLAREVSLEDLDPSAPRKHHSVTVALLLQWVMSSVRPSSVR